jgi:hypothetical protein
MRTSVSRYYRRRFTLENISHCVWLYFRFALSFRDVEEMLAIRGVIWRAVDQDGEWADISVPLVSIEK